MADTHPPEAWADLGRSLQLRRWQLGFRYRREFARKHGSAGIEKTLSRLENGERPGTYSDAMIASVEALYTLSQGAVQRYLSAWPDAKLDVDDTPSEAGPHFADPRLDAIAKLPPESPQTPWGFTQAELEALMALDLGGRALRKMQQQDVPAAAGAAGEGRHVTYKGATYWVGPDERVEDLAAFFEEPAAAAELPFEGDNGTAEEAGHRAAG